MRYVKIVIGWLAGFLLSGLAVTSMAATQFINIGSGASAGLYYPTAVKMAKIINQADIDMRAYVQVTGASVDNDRQVGQGTLQMGLTQNNMAYYAYQGEDMADFASHPEKNLRGVTMLYPETLQILVRKDRSINDINDLKDKRVYVGDKGSGTVEDVKRVLEIYHMSQDDFHASVKGNSGDAVNLLRDGQIDAMFYTVGIGSPAVKKALATGQVKLLAIPADKVDKLHKKYPFYTHITIPASTYPSINQDISAVTLKAMLVTSSDLPEDTIFTFMQTVFDKHLDSFQNTPENPNLKTYFRVDKGLEGMPIPLHKGAIKFFKQHDINTDHVPQK